MKPAYTDTAESPATSEVLSYLKGDEHLLWWGKPRAGVLFESGDILAIPLIALWTALVLLIGLFLLWGVGSQSWPALLVIVPMLLFGLYFLVGRFIVDAKRREHTTYIATDRRLLIVTKWPDENVESFDLRKLPKLEVEAEPGGEGTVTFGSVPLSSRIFWAGSISMGIGPKPPRFRAIQRSREVYEIIREARESLLHPEQT